MKTFKVTVRKIETLTIEVKSNRASEAVEICMNDDGYSCFDGEEVITKRTEHPYKQECEVLQIKD